MLGRFESARGHLARGRQIYDELGDRAHLARACAAMAGHVETLASDLNAAERAWREGYEILEGIGDVSFLASHAAELAGVLYAQARYAEADEYSHVAEGHAAPDDIYTQVLWRTARAKVVAQQGDPALAERLAQEAVELVSRTDALVLLGRARLALAEVLSLDRRFPDALRAARAALETFVQKGDVVSARETRALIRRLESEGALTEMTTV